MPNTEVLTGVATLAMPPNVRLGIRSLVLASGYSSGVLMPDAARWPCRPAARS